MNGSNAMDVIVVGSGLAGLTAAIRLQRDGYRVLVIERRAVAGGLCGTWCSDGREFVRACNDFGQGLVHEMTELGVPVKFLDSHWRIHVGQAVLNLPPTLETIARLLPYAPRILRLVLAARRHGYKYLGELLEQQGGNGRLADLAGVLANTAGMPLRHIRLEDIRTNLFGEYRYGLHKFSNPAGGPQALTDGMVARFESLGGRLQLETECLDIQRDGSRHCVVTNRGSLVAKQVITSQPRWDQYDERTSGLAIGQLLLAVKKECIFPPRMHGLYHIPRGVAQWIDQLDAGEPPAGFGFHLARSDLPEKPDHYTISLFIAMPRGEEEPSPERVRTIESYVFEHAETMLPGLNRALIYKRFLSPAEFSRIHHLPSTPVLVVLKAGMRKPAAYDSVTDIHYVGNSVEPPGEHSGGAVVSGVMAAERVARALASPVARPVQPH